MNRPFTLPGDARGDLRQSPAGGGRPAGQGAAAAGADQPGGHPARLDPDFQSHHGSPVPSWYFFGEPARRYALPLDFLWGMAFRASPGCQNGPQGSTCPQSCNLQ